jgi:hypothetical protein
MKEQSEDSLPDDFDWRAYLLRYSDLREGNVRNRDAAVWHYLARGGKEGRSYAKIPVTLRYTACQGLFNQMYAHLNALILADYLGADVVLPPSVYRHSFSEYFSTDLSRNKVKWTPASGGALLDVQRMREVLGLKGERRAQLPWPPDPARPGPPPPPPSAGRRLTRRHARRPQACASWTRRPTRSSPTAWRPRTRSPCTRTPPCTRTRWCSCRRSTWRCAALAGDDGWR